MESESSVTRNVNRELQSSDIQAGEIQRESGVTRSVIDESHSWNM